ncbi:MAG: enoyl-CoA hydratase [Acidobacteriota bacterium]|jgi:enoyl-CoA hydratase|nr:enoyl-CoA hydratase [Acidobacteriota bacterium]
MTIVLEDRDDSAVVRVRLELSAGRHPLTQENADRLEQIFNDLSVRTNLRAVMLMVGAEASPGRADRSVLANDEDKNTHAAIARLRRVCDSIEACPVPVIAVIDGPLSDDACELVLACHIRIASSNARFSLSENQLARVSIDKGIQRLKSVERQRVAVERMREGDHVMADEALLSGMVNRVVPRETLLAEAEAFTCEVTVQAPLAIRACLQAVLGGTELSLEEGLELEAQLFSSLFATEDMREGTSAFLEKRSPVFKGR